MSTILHEQELASFKAIFDYFKDGNRYVMLLAPMQSGKSNTFKMVGAEMLRRKRIDRVVIFSGNREKSLFKQTKSHVEFKEAYAHFLDIAGREEEEIESALAAVDRFEVVWGADLKRFDPRSAPQGENRILYIWEESHYGQSRRQQVDLFLTRIGIQASGSFMPEGCYLLSVSATPFSELADLYHFQQSKKVVRLVPGTEYISISKMRSNGQIRSVETAQEGMIRIFDALTSDEGPVRKYVLVRATKAQQSRLTQLVPLWMNIVHYDQAHAVDDAVDELEMDPLNSMLRTVPEVPTIVFLKGMCRMGKRVDKTNVVAVMETSCDKTDTLAQGLLGRMCGYGPYSHIQVYLVKVNEAELDSLAKLHDGDLESVPSRGTNMLNDSARATYRVLRMMGYTYNSDPEDSLYERTLAAMDTSAFVDHNLPEDRSRIIPILRSHLASRTGVKIHEHGRTLEAGLPRLRELFDSGEVALHLGNGIGIAANESEVVLYDDVQRRCVYVVANLEGRPVPVTTKRETFAPRAVEGPLPFNCGGVSAEILPAATRSSSTELEGALMAYVAKATKEPEKYKQVKVNSNGHNGIWLDPLVYNALTGGESGIANGEIARRLKEKGITLHTQRKRGATPANCSCVRIAEITITIQITVTLELSVSGQ